MQNNNKNKNIGNNKFHKNKKSFSNYNKISEIKDLNSTLRNKNHYKSLIFYQLKNR